jgi:hypothetical protein
MMNWTLRTGLVVHRESIPLSQLRNLTGRELAAGHFEHGIEGRSLVRVSDEEMLFSTSRWFSSADDAAIVTKGSVVIKGGNAEIVYRASVGATIFLTLWFGLLIAGEITIWFFPPDQPLPLASVLVAMIAGGALLVRRTVRVERTRLRGVALEAAMRLRDRL